MRNIILYLSVAFLSINSSLAQHTSDQEKAFLSDLFGPSKQEEDKPVPSITSTTNMHPDGTRFDEEGNMFVPANKSGVDYYHREATLSGSTTDSSRRFVLQQDDRLQVSGQPETVVNGSLEHSIAVAHGKPHRILTAGDKVKLAADRQHSARLNDDKHMYSDDGPELKKALEDYKYEHGIEGDISIDDVARREEIRSEKIKQYGEKYGNDAIHNSGVGYDEDAMIRTMTPPEIVYVDENGNPVDEGVVTQPIESGGGYDPEIADSRSGDPNQKSSTKNYADGNGEISPEYVDQDLAEVYVDEDGNIVDLDPEKYYEWGEGQESVGQKDSDHFSTEFGLLGGSGDEGVVAQNEDDDFGLGNGEIVGLDDFRLANGELIDSDGNVVLDEADSWGLSSIDVDELKHDLDKFKQEEEERRAFEKEQEIERERIAEIVRLEEAERQREADIVRAEEARRYEAEQKAYAASQPKSKGGFMSFLGAAVSVAGTVVGIKEEVPELVSLSGQLGSAISGDEAWAGATQSVSNSMTGNYSSGFSGGGSGYDRCLSVAQNARSKALSTSHEGVCAPNQAIVSMYESMKAAGCWDQVDEINKHDYEQAKIMVRRSCISP